MRFYNRYFLSSLIAVLLVLAISSLNAQIRLSSSDVGIGLYPTPVTKGQKAIVVNWDLPDDASQFALRRRVEGGSYQTISLTTENETSYTDTDIVPGIVYEYEFSCQLQRSISNNGNEVEVPWRMYGYCKSGIELDAHTQEGKTVLLVVDDVISVDIAEALDEFKLSLLQDGWGYREIQAPRTEKFSADSVQLTHQMIVEAIEDEPSISSIFLIGRIAVPYSGNIVPDGHTNNHVGAWPFDAFYASKSIRQLRDDIVNNDTGPREETKNIPGDGKFDHDAGVPIDLPIGRADFYNMPAFEQSEAELLNRYLRRAAEWHRGEGVTVHKGFVDDNFGAYGRFEAFAASGYRNFRSLLGFENTVRGDWELLLEEPYLFSYGCGGGTYTSAGGTVKTSDFTSGEWKGAFGFLFGSYFGDWDTKDNLMRASLASGNLLTCGWAGRPHWFIHGMSAGETMGDVFMTSYHNTNEYLSHIYPQNGSWAYINTAAFNIHIALMGDPTLNLYPSTVTETDHNLTKAAAITNTAALEWDDDGTGTYILLRSDNPNGPYSRIADTLITGGVYEDVYNIDGTAYYQLRRLDSNLDYGADVTRSYFAGDIAVDLKDWSTVEELASGGIQIIANQERVKITSDFKGRARLHISDISGRLIGSKEVILVHGENLFSMKTLSNNSLARGQYIILLETEAGKYSVPFANWD